MAHQKDVVVGQVWTAKVSQRIVQVKVLSVVDTKRKGARLRFRCHNMDTGRDVTMTAGKLRDLKVSVTAPA